MDTNLPIGLNAEDSATLSKELNALLCDLHVFYQNVRGFHWNVQGQNFFELHLKFEEFYTDLQLKIDEVAERILTLGGTPLHSMQDYVAGATIPAVKDVKDGVEAVRHCAAARRAPRAGTRPPLPERPGQRRRHQRPHERLHPRAGKDLVDAPRVPRLTLSNRAFAFF